MSFAERSTAYEAWLRTKCEVVETDLDEKRARMRKDAFKFLRATFFRWAGKIEEICPELSSAPEVLTPGDVHAENFGTWRDADGRLVYGINDHDEASVIPYAFDLVRLATSLRLRAKDVDDDARINAAVAAVLAGYRTGLTEPRPILLDETGVHLRPYVTTDEEDTETFWSELNNMPEQPPADVGAALRASMPSGADEGAFQRRFSGGGSRGRPRWVLIATWQGGRVVREAKALVPSAWDWAHGDGAAPPRILELARSASRSRDPHLDVRGGWIVRRLAPDSRKLELGDGRTLPPEPVLRAMGQDLGALHGGLGQAGAIGADLHQRGAGWLGAASGKAARWVRLEWKAFRQD